MMNSAGTNQSTTLHHNQLLHDKPYMTEAILMIYNIIPQYGGKP